MLRKCAKKRIVFFINIATNYNINGNRQTHMSICLVCTNKEICVWLYERVVTLFLSFHGLGLG